MAAWCESSSQLQRKRPASNTYHPHLSTKRVAWSHLLFRGEHWLNEGLEYQRKSHTTDAPGAWEGLLSVISSNFWWRNAKRSILTETGRKGRIRGQDRGVRERSPRRWTGHWGVLLLWGHTLVPLYWPLSCWELGEGQCLALGAGRGAWPADTEQPVHRGWEWCGLGAAKWHLSLPVMGQNIPHQCHGANLHCAPASNWGCAAKLQHQMIKKQKNGFACGLRSHNGAWNSWFSLREKKNKVTQGLRKARAALTYWNTDFEGVCSCTMARALWSQVREVRLEDFWLTASPRGPALLSAQEARLAPFVNRRSPRKTQVVQEAR